MLSLSEAIEHAEEVAGKYEEDAREGELQLDGTDVNRCRKCAKEHYQLAEWLKLLKRILDSGDCNDCAMHHSQCRYAPELGEQVRYNCPFYEKEES